MDLWKLERHIDRWFKVNRFPYIHTYIRVKRLLCLFIKRPLIIKSNITLEFWQLGCYIRHPRLPLKIYWKNSLTVINKRWSWICSHIIQTKIRDKRRLSFTREKKIPPLWAHVKWFECIVRDVFPVKGTQNISNEVYWECVLVTLYKRINFFLD